VGPRAGLAGGKSRPLRDSIPDRPARSQLLYRLSYRAHRHRSTGTNIRMLTTFLIKNGGHTINTFKMFIFFSYVKAVTAYTIGDFSQI